MNLGKTLLIVNPTAKSGEGETAARTAEELLRIPSLGRRSIDKYGADILQLVAGYKKEKHIKP